MLMQDICQSVKSFRPKNVVLFSAGTVEEDYKQTVFFKYLLCLLWKSFFGDILSTKNLLLFCFWIVVSRNLLINILSVRDFSHRGTSSDSFHEIHVGLQESFISMHDKIACSSVRKPTCRGLAEVMLVC